MTTWVVALSTRSEARRRRFFGYLNLFVAAMLMLILSAIDVVVIALIWHEYRQIRPAPEL